MKKRGLVTNTCAPPSQQNITEQPSSSCTTSSTNESNFIHNEIDSGNPSNVVAQVREIFTGGHNVHSHQPDVCIMPNPIAMHTMHSHTTEPVILGNANQTGIAPIYSLVTYNFAPGKTEQAIWSNEFVELHCLLKTQPEEMTLTLNAINELVKMPKSSPKAMSINSWISAFTIKFYMDIYVQAPPNEFSPLLTYMNIIRDLDRGYGQAAFNSYDRSFRSHRQKKKITMSHYSLPIVGKINFFASSNSKHF
jgi:hypothetical protein